MRAVVLSYSHHGFGMGRTAVQLGHELAGAFDPLESERSTMAETFGCPVFDTAAECLETAKPDIALVSGRHTLAPSYLRACVDAGVPCLFDKPWADCADRLRPAVDAAEATGLWGALTLPTRELKVFDVIGQSIADGTLGDLAHFHSRLSTSKPTRYDNMPSAWHNDPSISGGGCWAVECQHGIDIMLDAMGGQPVRAVAGVISNAMFQRPFEDYAAGLFRAADGSTGLVECSYAYPLGDHAGEYVIRAVGANAIILGQYTADLVGQVQVHTSRGVRVYDETPRADMMASIMGRSIQALANGDPPPIPLRQAVRILELQDGVYDLARQSSATNGPHLMATPAPRPV